MMLPGIFLNYRLKAAPSFMASFSRQTKGYRYMSGVREREEGHVNLNSHHVTPTELDINKKTINNS